MAFAKLKCTIPINMKMNKVSYYSTHLKEEQYLLQHENVLQISNSPSGNTLRNTWHINRERIQNQENNIDNIKEVAIHRALGK